MTFSFAPLRHLRSFCFVFSGPFIFSNAKGIYDFHSSVSGSRLLELLYGKDSNFISNLLDVLFTAGDPPIQPDIKHDFPASLMPHKELTVKDSELHPDIETIYQIILKLAGINIIDRHLILESIVSYLELKKKEPYIISKAIARLLKALLQSKADIELFIERGKD